MLLLSPLYLPLAPHSLTHLVPSSFSQSLILHHLRLTMMEKSRSVPDCSSSSYYSFDYDQDRSRSYNFNGPSSGTDPELKRKRRVASYNVLTMEGKLKSSVRNSFKWIKSKVTGDIRYGSS